MKAIQSFFFLSIFSLFLSCDGDGTSNHNPNVPDSQNSNTISEPADNQTDTAPITNTTLEVPKCEVAGTVLDGNVFWAKEANLLVCVAANEETKDAVVELQVKIAGCCSRYCLLISVSGNGSPPR